MDANKAEVYKELITAVERRLRQAQENYACTLGQQWPNSRKTAHSQVKDLHVELDLIRKQLKEEK